MARVVPAPFTPPLGAFGEAGLKSGDLIFAVNLNRFGDDSFKWWEDENIFFGGMEAGAQGRGKKGTGGGDSGKGNRGAMGEEETRSAHFVSSTPSFFLKSFLRSSVFMCAFFFVCVCNFSSSWCFRNSMFFSRFRLFVLAFGFVLVLFSYRTNSYCLKKVV